MALAAAVRFKLVWLCRKAVTSANSSSDNPPKMFDLGAVVVIVPDPQDPSDGLPLLVSLERASLCAAIRFSCAALPAARNRGGSGCTKPAKVSVAAASRRSEATRSCMLSALLT